MNAKKIAIGFMVLIACIIFKTFSDYGVTWDEAFHWLYGKAVFSWFQTGFQDRTAVEDPFFIYYGGLFDLPAWLAGWFLPFGPFETRHLLGSLLGLWTIFVSWKISRRISGDVAGLFTVMILAAHPVFYGHMYANPVDIPFGAFFITAVYYFLLLYENLPKPPLRILIQLGVVVGLALGIRASGMPIFFLIFLVCWMLWGIKIIALKKREWFAKTSLAGAKWGWNYLWFLAIAWLMMILFWPFAQLNPVTHPFLAIQSAAKWGFKSTVFFEGSLHPTTQLPKYYLFKSMLISMPEFFIFALGIGTVLLFLSLVRKGVWTCEKLDHYAKISLIIFPVGLSFVMSYFFQKTQYDSFRLFLFLIPLLAILCGESLTAFFRFRLLRPAQLMVGLVLFSSWGLTVWDMIRLHPYQTVYFNRLFAGGLKSAALQYETDFWGSSYKEGIEWVIENYHPDFQRKIRIQNSSAIFQTGYYLNRDPRSRDRFEMVEKDADVYLSITRWDLHKAYPGKILHIVQRDQVPLLYVIEVKKK